MFIEATKIDTEEKLLINVNNVEAAIRGLHSTFVHLKSGTVIRVKEDLFSNAVPHYNRVRDAQIGTEYNWIVYSLATKRL